MKIAMIGTGYVGLVTGTCFAEVGHDVICVDANPDKISALENGISPIFEPGLEDMIRRNVDHDRLRFTVNLSWAIEDAAIAFIAVGTPEGEDGAADLSHVKAVAQSLGRLINSDMLVVVKSTVPVGTCDMVEQIIDEELAKRNVIASVSVASNPEFLKEGNAIQDFMHPDRIVVGLQDDSDVSAFRTLYKTFIFDDQGKLLIMDRRSSELTKYGANAMLATRISFMNELAILCEEIGANIDNVRMGIGADARIGRKFLYAGPGFGGSCFPKDVAALLRTSQAVGINLKVLNAVTDTNHHQKQFIFQKIKRYFGNLRGKRVAIWGLTFKPGTDDVREAPSKDLIQNLLREGAYIVAHDPEGQTNFEKECGPNPSLTFAESAYEAISNADALVLMTEWGEYRRPNWDKVARIMAQNVVFDFRNQYDRNELISRGFYYECIGRPDSRDLRPANSTKKSEFPGLAGVPSLLGEKAIHSPAINSEMPQKYIDLKNAE